METGKIGKYFKYAIGEIVLVVIGILIALSINNWNEQEKEEKQVRNIYARIVQDFNQTAKEIERDVASMIKRHPLMIEVLNGQVNRDSLINDLDYFKKYWNCTTGFPDIKINNAGILLLESKIETNYELNNKLYEALAELYSEQVYELEVDTRSLEYHFKRLVSYIIEKGIRVDYVVKGDRTTFINMVFEDEMFKNYFFPYQRVYKAVGNRLTSFKTKGQVLIDKIKTEYHLE